MCMYGRDCGKRFLALLFIMGDDRMDGRLDRRIKEAAGSKEFRAVWEAVQNILFPLVLLLFPLIKANQGVDLTDTGYSLEIGRAHV